MQDRYYYIKGDRGMKSNGSFTKDRSKWMTFDQNEVERIGSAKPYGATMQGKFVLVD
jgi:hypothetical protein